MSFSSLPNALSILRIILTVPVVLFLLNHQFSWALMLFFIAGITDALDGWIAKRYSFQTRLGSMLDPAADKLLLVSSFITLYMIDLLPLWLLALIFLRDVMIVSGTVGSFMGSGQSKSLLLAPSKLSKINTALQITLVLFLVIMQLYPALSQWEMILFIIVATSTMLSGADYIWIWTETVLHQEKQQKK
ncbi:CDP-diacylglycerol--glycerol-3-phosphate 3-phosphatidyltransferase [Bathymodiolus thermophilus thioautotrophic gill symbiont]|uniref:CDP-diacylglycerol--glycerol-3-phosphate 3-phosphatidyltransferase n=1 Tax=Bathymodiolus thermophilus thioautotrophic gill symbiont TaxID=2360 RepID=A0A1J5TUK8_9GAMM|nr:CDP-alcohol phosphatidyltransferase family protein [Bathymodiolus thermophilus thioautotrophic gill symbiont]AYQ56139.1 CDP-alcohol phosphatidyltransferase [Bathymodiolus thermophilus thioautotrophic gill symbiont]OIR23852.1 CDP-alcohol phosphatidyltransferase [Bathymodiolus thermophilus thioautotrophic gill symbiont]CAB5502222.1 Cardiolipin synthase (CMP-forming), eukaryotic type Cls-II (EC [Bathymodiolus thermophilus thioautotrophic gill symbiont]CAB5504887.1 Cardiolipin synthase (CMP-form